MEQSYALAWFHLLSGPCFISINCIVLIVLNKVEYLQTRSNIYIASIAYVDASAAFVQISFGLKLLPIIGPWFDTNKVACLAIFNMFYFTKMCSITHTFLISVDRFLFMRKPIWYAREVTEKRVQIALIIVWASSFLFGSVVWFTNTYDDNRPPDCYMQAVVPNEYTVCAAISLHYLALVSAGVLYSIIGKDALKRHTEIKQYSVAAERFVVGAPACAQEQKSADLNMSRLLFLKHSIRRLKLFVIVCGVTFLCWLPFHIVQILDLYAIELAKDYIDITMAIGFLNSALDVVVYPCYSRNFRIALRYIVCGNRLNGALEAPSVHRISSTISVSSSRSKKYVSGLSIARTNTLSLFVAANPLRRSGWLPSSGTAAVEDVGVFASPANPEGIIILMENWDKRRPSTGPNCTSTTTETQANDILTQKKVSKRVEPAAAVSQVNDLTMKIMDSSSTIMSLVDGSTPKKVTSRAGLTQAVRCIDSCTQAEVTNNTELTTAASQDVVLTQKQVTNSAALTTATSEDLGLTQKEVINSTGLKTAANQVVSLTQKEVTNSNGRTTAASEGVSITSKEVANTYGALTTAVSQDISNLLRR